MKSNISQMGSPYNPFSPISVGTRDDSLSNPSTPSSLNSPRSATGPKQPRQRLRPWLIDQINSGEIPGLVWLDREALSFKIPWKHFGRPGINEYEDALLFRRWALHTKKFREGEQADISTWKTRFRCALHKLPDIEELHNFNQKDGDEPYRVYRFKKKGSDIILKEIEIEPPPCSGVPLVQNKQTFVLPQTKIEDSPASMPANANPVWMSPESNHDLEFPQSNTNDDDDGTLIFDELDLMADPNLDNNLVDDILQGQQQPFNPDNGSGTSNGGASFSEAMNQTISTLNSIHNSQNVPDLQFSSLEIKLYYADKEVAVSVIDNPSGLRIAFNPPPPLPNDVVQDDAAQFVSHIFGPFQAEQIYFPPTDDACTMKILECIRRGLVLQSRNGQILATRLCRAKIFYSDSVVNCGNELPREHTIVIFDYANDFYPKLRNYMMGQGPSPTYERYFSFAQKWSQNAPLSNNYVRVTVTQCWAQKQLNEFQKQKPDLLISDPNMLDYIAQQIDGLNLIPSN